MSAPCDDGCGGSDDRHLEAVERELVRSEREAVRRLVDARRAEVAQLRQVNRRLRTRLNRAQAGAELSPWGTPRGGLAFPVPMRHDGPEPVRSFRPAARLMSQAKNERCGMLCASSHVGTMDVNAVCNLDQLRREVARIRVVLEGGNVQALEAADELEPDDCRMNGVPADCQSPDDLVTLEEADLMEETRNSRLRVEVLEHMLCELRQPGLPPFVSRQQQRRLLQMVSIVSSLHDANRRRRMVGHRSSSLDTRLPLSHSACLFRPGVECGAAEASPAADIGLGSWPVIGHPCVALSVGTALLGDAGSDVKAKAKNQQVQLMARRMLLRRDLRCG